MLIRGEGVNESRLRLGTETFQSSTNLENNLGSIRFSFFSYSGGLVRLAQTRISGLLSDCVVLDDHQVPPI